MDAHLTEGGRWLHGCFWDGCLQARQLAPLISHGYEALDDGRLGGHPDHLDDDKLRLHSSAEFKTAHLSHVTYLHDRRLLAWRWLEGGRGRHPDD